MVCRMRLKAYKPSSRQVQTRGLHALAGPQTPDIRRSGRIVVRSMGRIKPWR